MATRRRQQQKINRRHQLRLADGWSPKRAHQHRKSEEAHGGYIRPIRPGRAATFGGQLGAWVFWPASDQPAEIRRLYKTEVVATDSPSEACRRVLSGEFR